MKFVKSYLIQKAKGRKTGRYLITLEVTDYDIEMIEDLVMSYVPFELNDAHNDDLDKRMKDGTLTQKDWDSDTLDICSYTEKYSKWLNRLFFRCFHKLWRQYE